RRSAWETAKARRQTRGGDPSGKQLPRTQELSTKRKPGATNIQHQEPAGIDPRASAAGLQRKRLHAWLKFSNERRLLQERRERTACGALELLGVNRAIIVGIGSLEAFLDDARNSFLSRVPSLSGSAAAKSFALSRPRNSRLSRVPSWSRSSLSNSLEAALFASARSTVPSLSVSSVLTRLCDHAGPVPISVIASNQYGLSSDAHVHVL